MNHPAEKILQDPFVNYVGNAPKKARDHFFGLLLAKPDLRGVAVFDRLENDPLDNPPLVQMTWRKREIENYLTRYEVLSRFAESGLYSGGPLDPRDLFGDLEIKRRVNAMEESIRSIGDALYRLRRVDPWSPDIKATDDFLDPLFKEFYERLELPLYFAKSNYHELANFILLEEIDPEIVEKLDAIRKIAQSESIVE